MKNEEQFIAIYEDNESENLAHIVESIAEASKWVGCSVQAFYDSFHRTGRMKARGYFLEVVVL